MGAQQGKESNSTSGSLPRHHQHHGMVLQHSADAVASPGGGADPIPTATAPKSRIKGLRTRSSSHHVAAAAATATPSPAMPRSVSPLVAAGSSGDGVVQTGKVRERGMGTKVLYMVR